MKQTKLHDKTRMFRLLTALLLLLSATSCNEQKSSSEPSAQFAPYVEAYTGGILSRRSSIRIELAQEQPLVELNQPLKDNPFTFSPALKGEAYWTDNRTIEFVPEENALQPDKYYEATFQLGRFVKVNKELGEFKFHFRVQPKDFVLQMEPLTIDRADNASWKGFLLFSDDISKEEVEQMVFRTSGESGNKKLPTTTVQTTADPSRYEVQITDIPRTDRDYTLELEADGTGIGFKRQQQVATEIPAQGAFRLLSARRMAPPENGIEATFSDPINPQQNLQGLVEIREAPQAIRQIENNRIYLYVDSKRTGTLTLELHQGLSNAYGQTLEKAQSLALSEINLKPQVKFHTQAAILPETDRWVLPFQAVNLHAVDISVIRIYEKNLPTFLQENTFETSSQLRRSGRLIYRNTLWLGRDKSKNLHQWEDYTVDLGGLIRQEPGALYRVILSFKQEYSAYPCNGNEETHPSFATTNSPGNALSPDEEAEWDVPNSYIYYTGMPETDWRQYQWSERDNPCHPSYYMTESRAATCNVLASNLGLTVKRNSSNTLWVTANRLTDTEPIQDAQITVYNFQLQPIGSGLTDRQGFAEIAPQNGVPFLVVAAKGEEKAYLRIVDGEEQSVSRFDVDGREIHKGLKGFIYGERGVWRPGDTLHVSFILEDKAKRIPDQHPVSLEVYTPTGQFYAKQIATQGLNGFYTFHLPTRKDAPTGLWHAYIKVGGTSFYKSLRIETVKPNRLKINLQLPSTILAASPQTEIPATITSAWLTGATASGLETRVEMSLTRVNTQFKGYEQYLFNNPASNFSSVKEEIFKGNLNSQGQATFNIKLPHAIDAPGMLNATFTTRVFEPGGDASIHTQGIPFSPFSSYVGIRLNQPEGKYIETDTEHVFDVVTLTPDGRATDRNDLEYKIYRVDWSWWWENREESFATYINGSSITPVKAGKLATRNGKTSFTFQVNYPEWGRYLVYVKDRTSGHATGGTIYVDWPDWRGRSNKQDPDNLKMLTFTLDKTSYAPGEKATAIIPASAGGHALVALENGSTVLRQEWIALEPGKDTKYSFDITPEMAPNVYLHITLLQAHEQTVNDLPMRMYGVMPVAVKDPQTILHPTISMPDLLRPETDFRITVSEQSGRPMTYTLAIVDEGLLDLTNFKTPDPWNEFYAREALGIRTWDLYDHVLGAKNGSYPAMFSTGGDENLKPADSKANRFNPVIRFIGPFHLKKGEKQSHTLRLPTYVGSVRTMVVAGYEGAYGKAEKTTPVRTPLMLLSTLPRTLSTGEDICVPVNIFAMEGDAKKVTASMQTEGCDIQIQGQSTRHIVFRQPGDTLIKFRIKTQETTGKATIRLKAQSGKYQAQETVEIDVRNPNPAFTSRKGQWLQAGQTLTLPYSGENIQEAHLEVSRIPSFDVCRRIGFLQNYMHLCTEQLTSKALPLLYLQDFMEVSPQESAKIKDNTQESIYQLYTRQLNDGSFVYWPGNAVADEWITSYAGMYLTLAKEKGYSILPQALNRWKNFQGNAARNWRMPSGVNAWQSCMQQAYRLYTLALAGAPEYGAMNRLKEQTDMPLQARWMLAGAYALAGQNKIANELTYNLSTAIPAYARQNSIYGSNMRDEAFILEALLQMGRQAEALEQARRLSAELADEQAFDTQSTAFALMAMGRLAGDLSGTLSFSWKVNDGEKQQIASVKAGYITSLPSMEKSNAVTITNQGEGALNAEIITRTQPCNDTLPALSRGLRMDIKYVDLKGQPIHDISHIRQGSDFIAAITINNLSATQAYDRLALTQILPSGWEVQGEVPGIGNPQAGYDYRDIRDDRVLTYFGLRAGEQKHFEIRLQATYAGTFILPALQCEDMYDTSIMARTKAGTTTIE